MNGILFDFAFSPMLETTSFPPFFSVVHYFFFTLTHINKIRLYTILVIDSCTFLESDEACNGDHPHVWFGIVCIFLVIVGLIGNLFVAFVIITLREYKKSVANL